MAITKRRAERAPPLIADVKRQSMALRRVTQILLLAGVLAGCGKSALVEPPGIPTEVDTVIAGRTVAITQIRGEILRKLEDGSLVPVAEGDPVSPGEILLVRRGAEFSIGNDTIGAEHHGDRWVKFE